jgi:hypothetical protein
VNNEFGEHQAVYRVIPGDRSYEIETAVWIWASFLLCHGALENPLAGFLGNFLRFFHKRKSFLRFFFKKVFGALFWGSFLHFFGFYYRVVETRWRLGWQFLNGSWKQPGRLGR